MSFNFNNKSPIITATYANANSSAKTPTATVAYLQMASNVNFVSLTAGDWNLTGNVFFDSVGSVGYTETDVLWAGADGNDSSSPAPATLASVATVLAGMAITTFFWGTTPDVTGFWCIPAQSVRIRLATTTTIYLVPFVRCATNANSRVTTQIYAMRVA